MKESVRNFIEIMILIVIGGTWGFFCSKIFPNTTVSMIAAIFGGFAIGYILAHVFIRIRNGEKITYYRNNDKRRYH